MSLTAHTGVCKALFIREGPPLAVRMSKVAHEMVKAGFECHVLADIATCASHNIAREMGLELDGKLALYQWPLSRRWPFYWLDTLLQLGEIPGGRFERAIRRILASGGFDLVIVKDTAQLRRVLRCLRQLGMADVPVMCDMYENMPELLFDTKIRFASFWRGQLAAWFRLVQRARRVERECLPECERIFVVVDEMKQHLVASYGLDPGKVSVVENVELLSFFDSVSEKDAGEPWPAVPVVLYFGGFGPFRGLEVLIDAARILAGSLRAPFRVAIVGASSEEKRAYDSIVAEKKLSDYVSILKRVTHHQGIACMKRSVIGVIPHADTAMIRTTVPNKIFQYMAAGLPVVTSNVGPLGRIVRECKCGVTFAPGSATELASRLKALLDNPDEAVLLGASGRSWVERRYCWEKAGAPYREYFAEIKSRKLNRTAPQPSLVR